jgi:hypothetical protein
LCPGRHGSSLGLQSYLLFVCSTFRCTLPGSSRHRLFCLVWLCLFAVGVRPLAPRFMQPLIGMRSTTRDVKEIRNISFTFYFAENSKLLRRIECLCSKVVRGFSVPVGLGVHWDLSDWVCTCLSHAKPVICQLDAESAINTRKMGSYRRRKRRRTVLLATSMPKPRQRFDGIGAWHRARRNDPNPSGLAKAMPSSSIVYGCHTKSL